MPEAVRLRQSSLPPLFFIVINEIAWMGTVSKEGESAQAAANNEWIELYNNGVEPVLLGGWKIVSEDGSPDISLNGVIQGNGYFLLERASDDILPDIQADIVYPYKNALSNSGERIYLKNAAGENIDEINASSGWPAGDNATKETMQKTGDGKWITAKATPKAKNQDSGTTNQNSQNQIIEPDQSKQIKVEAGKDKFVFVGQKTFLSSPASTLICFDWSGSII